MDSRTYRSMASALSSKVKAVFSAGITELFPWEYLEVARSGPEPLLLDIRCPHEFEKVCIPGSVNVPRRILEAACERGHKDCVPELVEARDRPVLVICISGRRSLLAARTLAQLGYSNVATLRTGLRGWNDYDLALYDNTGKQLDPDRVEAMFSHHTPEGPLELGQSAVA